MAFVRETIYSALWARVSSVSGLKTASRRLKHFADVPKGKQPALFQVEVGEEPLPQRGLPTKWTLKADLYLYVHSANDETPSSTIFNPILDAIVAVLDPPNAVSPVQTLDGNVSRCWIEGGAQIYEGVAAVDQTVIIVPVTMLTM